MRIFGRSQLTSRRRECLVALQRAVRTAGGPVHYSVIAEPLGISPWTAYDLLRELQREGLAAVTYAHRAGAAVGRPQVAFSPTDAGRAAVGDLPAAGDERALRRARASFAGLAPLAAARSAVERAARGLDLAGHLGFWLDQAERLPGRTRQGLHHLVRTAPEAATALSMFAAAVYGAASPGSSDQTVEALAAELSAFQARLARTTAARRERLARSLAHLLAQIGPPSDTGADAALHPIRP